MGVARRRRHRTGRLHHGPLHEVARRDSSSFAGMNRIKFNGFGFSPSQRLRDGSRGTPRSKAKCSRKRGMCANRQVSAAARLLCSGGQQPAPLDRFPGLGHLFGGALFGVRVGLRRVQAERARRIGLDGGRRTEPGQQQSERDDGEGGAHVGKTRSRRRRQPSVGGATELAPPGTRGWPRMRGCSSAWGCPTGVARCPAVNPDRGRGGAAVAAASAAAGAGRFRLAARCGAGRGRCGPAARAPGPPAPGQVQHGQQAQAASQPALPVEGGGVHGPQPAKDRATW